jgi:hypothetical protein
LEERGNNVKKSYFNSKAFLRHLHVLKSQVEQAKANEVVATQTNEAVVETPAVAKEETSTSNSVVAAPKSSIFAVIKSLKVWNIFFGVSCLFGLFLFSLLYFKAKKQLEQPQNKKKYFTVISSVLIPRTTNTPTKTARKIQPQKKESSSIFSILKSFANPYGKYT